MLTTTLDAPFRHFSVVDLQQRLRESHDARNSARPYRLKERWRTELGGQLSDACCLGELWASGFEGLWMVIIYGSEELDAFWGVSHRLSCTELKEF